MSLPQSSSVFLLFAMALIAGCGRAPETANDAATIVSERIEAGDLPGAEDRLRAAIAKWPFDWRLRELQGDIDLRRGNGTLAQTSFERAIRGSPANRRLQLKLARALLAQRRYREVAILAVPVAGDTDDVLAGFQLLRLEAGLALDSPGSRPDRDEVEALWRLAAKDSPGMAEIRARLGELATGDKLVEAARQHAQCRTAVAPARRVRQDAPAGRVLRVGPAEKLQTPGAAAAVAVDGDVIEIEAGRYEEGPVDWPQDGLTLRGRRGRPQLRLTGAGRPVAWNLGGGRTVIENVEFEDSGLRLGGGALTVRGSVFRGAGIIAADGPDSEVLVTGTEFDAQSRAAPAAPAAGPAVEAGGIAKLTIEFSYIHGARSGAAVTSRARRTGVTYNRIAAEAGPVVALPGGGRAEIAGNELVLGAGIDDSPFIAFGDADARGAQSDAALSVINNTFYSVAAGRVGVRSFVDLPLLVANNVFEGSAIVPSEGKVVGDGNFVTWNGLVGPASGDFTLVRGSSAIDAAVNPRAFMTDAPLAEFEYLHPVSGIARTDVWTPDAGAHEFCAAAPAAGGGADQLLPEPAGGGS